MIHETAVVDPSASLGDNVEIGPFCVVEPDVVVGNRCKLATGVVVKSGTILGEENVIGEGAVLGGLPQHIAPPGPPGRLEIGHRNTIREHVTMHRSLYGDQFTRIGDDGMFMVGAHIAHDCIVGNQVIITNHVLLAGHVTIGDKAVLGGASAVKQYCRVGELAMVGGLARIVQDVPPFMLIDGRTSQVVGLNSVGLRRAGFSSSEVKLLKEVYRVIYRSGLCWNDVLSSLREEFAREPASSMLKFFEAGSPQRGFVQERRTPPGAVLRLHRDREEAPLRHAV